VPPPFRVPCADAHALVASIVIPTFNRADSLRRSLDALSAQTTSERFEVIVVDDGSTDNTAEIVRCFPAVKLISSMT
jgi:GT2 family glycosyltransferase